MRKIHEFAGLFQRHVERPAFFSREARRRIRFPRGLRLIKVPRKPAEPSLPTLIRFVFVLLGLAAIVYGGLYYLATFVKIPPHQITETVELPKAPK